MLWIRESLECSARKSSAVLRRIWSVAAAGLSALALFYTVDLSAQGAYTNSIAIEAPGGAGGLRPSISLQYSSDAGNGHAGVGWSLSGLPAISRIAYGKPVKYNLEDTYAGPGGRLIDVSGTGAYYHSAMTDWARYEPSGSCGNGPCMWTVRNADGSVHYYGSTNDSRIEAVGKNGAVRVWALARVEDARGNAYTIAYDEDVFAGGYYPTLITYTVVPGMVAYRTIEFEWETRPDARSGFSHGAPWNNDRRLRSIAVRSGGSLVRRYALTYAQSAGSGRSLLAAVQEFGSDGSAAKSPVQFGWSASALPTDFVEVPADASGTVGANLKQYAFTMADVDGDGSDDFLGWINTWRNANDTWQNATFKRVTYLSNGDGTFRLAAFDQTGSMLVPHECPHVFPGEFNGDGMADLLVVCKSLNEVGWLSKNARVRRYTYLSNGDGTFREVRSNDTSDIDWLRVEYLRTFRTADINGDGLTDLVAPNTVHNLGEDWPGYVLTTKVWLASPNGTFTRTNRPVTATQTLVWAKMQVQYQDVNGDGFADVVAAGPLDGSEAPLTRTVLLGDGLGGFSDGPYSRTMTRIWSDYKLGFVDVNGDGAADIFAVKRGEQILFLNDGTGKFEYEGTRTEDLGAAWRNYNPEFGDWNGDGLLDIMAYRGSGADGVFEGTYYLGRGDGTFTQYPLTPGGQTLDFAATGNHVGDVNNDGRPDILYVQGEDTGALTRTAYLGVGDRQDLLISSNNGAGGVTLVQYERASRVPGVVVRHVASCGGASGVGYGQPCGVPNVSGRMLVVSQSLSDGRGASYAINYGYYNARVFPGDYRTSADLGFERVTATTMAGEVSATHFFQTQPYARQARISESFTASGQLRSRTVNGAPTPYKCNESGCQMGYTDADQLAFSLQLRPGAVESVAYAGGMAVSTTVSTPQSQDDYGNVLRTTQTIANRSGQIVKASCKANDVVNRLSGPRAIGFAYQESVFSDAACTQLVSGKRTYFDHQSLGSVGTRLLNTRTEQYVGSAADSGWAPTIFQHDSFGNITRETGPNGLSKTIAYDPMFAAFGVSIRDAMDRVTASVVDHRYNVPVEIIDPSGVTTRVNLDVFGRVVDTVITDNTGRRLRKSTNEYSASGGGDGVWARSCVHFGTGWLRESCAVEYRDGLNRVYKQQTSAGSVRTETVTEYDAAGRPYRTSKPYSMGGAPAYWTTTEFDEWGRPVRQTMPDGLSVNIAYDDVALVSGALRVVTANFPNGVSKRTHYNADDKPLQITDGIGSGSSATVSFEYDALGRVIASVAPNGQRVTVEYDGGGNRLRVVDPNAGVTSWTYNTTPGNASFGQVATQSRPAANDPAGATLATIEYDALGRPIKETVSDGSSTVYTYDEPEYANSYGRLTTSVHKTDGYTLTTNFSYDIFGKENNRIRTVTGPADLSFSGVYGSERDELGRETSVLYPDGSVFEIQYDDASRISALLLDGVEYASFDDYNLEGQVGSVEYRNGVTTRYAYDPARGSLLNLRSDSGSGAVLDLAYRFDQVGNITRITDNVRPELSSSYSYDSLNRLTSMVRNGQTFEFGFDVAGNITRKATIGANSELVHLNLSYYAGTNRLQSDGMNQYEWSAAGNLISRGDRSYRYTDRNMLKEVRRNGLVTVKNIYDQNGDRVVKIFQNRDGTEVRTFYVGAGYEIRERWSGPDRLAGQASKYVLGVDGAKMATVTSGQNLAEFGYETAAFNHYVYAGMMSWTLPGLAKKIKHLWLGMAAELSRALNSAPAPQREHAQALLGVALLVVFAALFLIQFRHIFARGAFLREFGARQAALAQAALVALFSFLPVQCGAVVDSAYGFATGLPHENSLIYGGPDALTGDTSMGLPVGTYFYHSDHLGSSSVVTDARGDVITRIAYLPYGEVDHINSPGNDTVTFKFTGQEYDPEAELYNYKARYYDPVIGLFTSADTMVPDPTNPMDHNRYMYVRGNPVRYTDPTGHYTQEDMQWWQNGVNNLLQQDAAYWGNGRAEEYMWVQLWYKNNSGGQIFRTDDEAVSLQEHSGLLVGDAGDVLYRSQSDRYGNNGGHAGGFVCGVYYCWKAPNNDAFLATVSELQESSSDGKVNVWINGVQNTVGDSITMASSVAFFQREWVAVVYNPTAGKTNMGLASDTQEAMRLLNGRRDDQGVVNLTVDVIEQLGGQVNIWAHSEGTAITAFALREYTATNSAAGISVVAYGAIDFMPAQVRTTYVYNGSGPDWWTEGDMIWRIAGDDHVADAGIENHESFFPDSDHTRRLDAALASPNQEFLYTGLAGGSTGHSYAWGHVMGSCWEVTCRNQ